MTELVEHSRLRVGDTVFQFAWEGANPNPTATILRLDGESPDPVLLGSPCWRYWARDEDGKEGSLLYGRGGMVRRVVKS